jgi:hypothetical protein
MSPFATLVQVTNTVTLYHSAMAGYSMLTIKKLFGLSMNQCAFPGCETKLVKPEWPGALGEICHICAASPKGPRYVANMTDEERYDYPNLILMCPTHHTWIDRLELDIYTIDALQEMKAKVEQSAMQGEKAMLEDLTKDDPSLVDRAIVDIIAMSERYYALDPLPPMPTSSPADLEGRVDITSTVNANLTVGEDRSVTDDSAGTSGVRTSFSGNMGGPYEDVTTVGGPGAGLDHEVIRSDEAPDEKSE